jgi:Putative zinc-finger
MECRSAKRKVSAYLDNAMSEQERRQLRQHLAACRACALESLRQEQLRNTMRSLPQRLAPPDLKLRLQVIASKARKDASARTSAWTRRWDRLELTLKHLMRPLALPALGGLCSAVLLFSALVPTFVPAFAMGNAALGDVPTMLTTQPMVKSVAPIAFGGGDAEVDLTIDDQGRIVDYVIVSAPGQKSEQLRRTIENNLLFIECWPATTFGKPIAGTVRISFRSTAGIDVRG